MKWDQAKGEWEPLEAARSDESVVFPIDANGNERVWNMGWKRAREEVEQSFGAKLVDGQWQIYRKYRPHEAGALPGTWWDHAKYSATESGTRVIKGLLGERELFSFPKSVYLVEDSLRASNCTDGSLIFDFFAGSGTTAHAVMNLNREDGGQRKYILVEMGEHFETVILPRIKKVAFSDQWRDGAAQPGGRGISHFVKYFTLEQYEDVLRRAVYGDAEPLFIQADPYSQYVFLRDLKLLDNAETGEAVMAIDPAADAVHVHLERLYPDVDVAETLSCVTGQRIRRLLPGEVEFEDGQRMSLLDPPWDVVKPLIWW